MQGYFSSKPAPIPAPAVGIHRSSVLAIVYSVDFKALMDAQHGFLPLQDDTRAGSTAFLVEIKKKKDEHEKQLGGLETGQESAGDDGRAENDRTHPPPFQRTPVFPSRLPERSEDRMAGLHQRTPNTGTVLPLCRVVVHRVDSMAHAEHRSSSR